MFAIKTISTLSHFHYADDIPLFSLGTIRNVRGFFMLLILMVNY